MGDGGQVHDDQSFHQFEVCFPMDCRLGILINMRRTIQKVLYPVHAPELGQEPWKSKAALAARLKAAGPWIVTAAHR